MLLATQSRTSALKWSRSGHSILSTDRITGHEGLFQDCWVDPNGVGCRTHVPDSHGAPGHPESLGVARGVQADESGQEKEEPLLRYAAMLRRHY